MVLPPSLQDSLPAGWLAFAGRGSNPLDRCKRFQIIHPPFLDFAWRKGSFMTFPPKNIENQARSHLQPMDFKLGMLASRWH
jgi:hypothetical protein